MPYDPGLAERLEAMVAHHSGMSEKRMFGGIVWLLHGNMCVGIHKEWLIIRVGVAATEKIFREPHVKPMDITGRILKGWAMVAPDGLEDDAALKRFCMLAMDFVKTLPKK